MLVATSPGLRDQRVRIYAPSNSFTDGYQSETYSFINEYWSRITVVTSRETAAGSPQQHLDFRTEAIAIFDEYATIPQNGILRYEELVYFIRGVIRDRLVNTQQAMLELVSTDRFQSFVLVHPPTTPVPDEIPTIDPVPLTPGYAT